MKVTAVVPSAGVGKRLKKKGLDKPYLFLKDKPLLAHTLLALERSPQINDVIVVVRRNQLRRCKEEIVKKFHLKKVKKIVQGGLARFDSVYNGLCALCGDADLVLIHDGARPLVSRGLLREVINAAKRYGAAIAAIPAIATVKVADDKLMIKATPNRKKIWLAQTPQAFRKDLIFKAYKEAKKKMIAATDDAALVERMGHPVKLVMGSHRNIKVTTPEDLELAGLLLR